MATRRWSVNTVRRRLVELNRFAGWLVERRYLQRSPMIGISVPRRERRLPRVLDWSQVEQIMAASASRGTAPSSRSSPTAACAAAR
jgi:site-specific recombinase XerC